MTDRVLPICEADDALCHVPGTQLIVIAPSPDAFALYADIVIFVSELTQELQGYVYSPGEVSPLRRHIIELHLARHFQVSKP